MTNSALGSTGQIGGGGCTAEESPVGAFVRGFFGYLEKEGVTAAVLHGWEDGFEGELSDVDFVVDPLGFGRLVALVNAWCKTQGWLLCQVLRHETTAAYCVCALADKPETVVALDACTDYQRNGLDYLAQAEMLAGRVLLPWGCYRVSEAIALRYRFAKAAAKRKDGGDSAEEFATYSVAARSDCEAWLWERWGIRLSGWDAVGVAAAVQSLRRWPASSPFRFLGRWLSKIVTRMARPAGMVVVSSGRSAAETRGLAGLFGHLYFRRADRADSLQLRHLMALQRSTVVLVDRVPTVLAWLLPPSWLLRLDPTWSPESSACRVVSALHRRCANREGCSGL